MQMLSMILPCLALLGTSEKSNDCHKLRTHMTLKRLEKGKWLKPSKFVAAREVLKWKV